MLTPNNRLCPIDDDSEPSATPLVVTGSCAAEMDGVVFVCGGTPDLKAPPRAKAVKDCHAFDLDTGKWARSSPLLHARRSAAAVQVPSVGLWVTGGRNETHVVMVR